jgi:hypothetical protein
MAETFFEPGKKSHCVFSPNLWCEVFQPASDFAPFEFLSDVTQRSVRVVLPTLPGKAGEIWDRIYDTIETVWQDRQVGFRCQRVTHDAWTAERPCVSCELVRQGQVVIIDFQGGDLRASGFREMASISGASLQLLKAFGPAPTKRVILIGCGPVVPPPLYQKIFDWVDYTGADGKPDLELLAAKMDAIAREGLFQSEATLLRLDPAEFEGQPAEAPEEPIPVLNDEDVHAAVAVDPEADIVITVLAETSVETAPEISKGPEDKFAEALARAESLVNEGRYGAAFSVLKDPDIRPADRTARVRELERECLTRMRARDLAEVYFRGLTGRHRSRFEVSGWSGEPAAARLALQGEDFMKRLGTLNVALYACDRLEPAAASALRRQLSASGQPAFVVVDGCEDAVCRSFAELRAQHVFEIHVSDLRRWALAGKSPLEGLRDRLRQEYRRPEDLFLRGLQGPVFGEDSFFGRRDLLDQLGGYLRSGDSFVVYGLPRSGKSSLLWRLSRLLVIEGSLLAFVDVRSEGARPASDLYVQTVRAIKEAVAAAYPANGRRGLSDLTKVGELFGLPADAPAEAFRGRFEADVKALGEKIRRKVDPRFERLVLLFDDLASILSAENRPFLTQLQNLTQEGSIAIGIAGAAFSLQEELKDAGAPLRGIQQNVLSGLDEEECSQMVRSIGHRMYSYFDSEAVSVITRASGGHPILVRYFCSAILESLSAGTAIVTEAAARDAIELTLGVKNLRRQLERIFKEVSKQFPTGLLLLQQMGQENGREESIDPVILAERVRLPRAVVAQNLAILTEYGLVASLPSGQFRPRIGLLSRWLQLRESGV